MQIEVPPNTEAELLQRAQALASQTLQSLAQTYNQVMPRSLKQAKGFIGQLIELALGANSANKPEPDFAHLGIELKTLPCNTFGSPQESTYVCTAPLPSDTLRQTWETSTVHKKLSKVLWVPIIEPGLDCPVEARRIGMPILWQPNKEIEATLKQDWEELMDMLHLGGIEKLSARFGTYLQIRPKAAHSRILGRHINESAELAFTGPKGFYLRTALTKQIMAEHYCL